MCPGRAGLALGIPSQSHAILLEASTPAHLALSTSKQHFLWEQERTHNTNWKIFLAVRSMFNTPSFALILKPRSIKLLGLAHTGRWVRYKVVWCCRMALLHASGEVIRAKDITGPECGQGLLQQKSTLPHLVSITHLSSTGRCVSPHSDTALLAQGPQW